MRKVVAYHLLSLDGVAEAPERFVTDWDDALDANLADVIGTQDTVLLGRRSYDEWSQYWPTSDIEPFASFINGVEKLVATSSTPPNSWPNTMFVLDDVAGRVRDLKSGTGGDIGLHASIALTQSLLTEGLVDVLHLVVAPVLWSSGRRLFGDEGATSLALSGHEVTPGGYLLVSYDVIH
jgi:dihydrofolate reductase